MPVAPAVRLAPPDPVRRLVVAKVVPRADGQTAGASVEPFVGSFSRWLDVDSLRAIDHVDPLGPQFPDAEYATRDRRAAERSADPLAVSVRDGDLRALDLAAGRTLWTTKGVVPASAQLRGFAAMPEEVSILSEGMKLGEPSEVVTFERATGLVAWRTPWRRIDVGAPWLVGVPKAGVVVVVTESGPKRISEGLEARSGRVLWSHEVAAKALPGTPIAYECGGRVVLLSGSGQQGLLVDGVSGAPIGNLTFPGRVLALTCGDHSAFVVTTNPSPAADGPNLRLSALPLDSVGIAWPNGASADTEIATLGDVNLFVRRSHLYFTALGLVRVYDVETGSLLWDFGLGEDTDSQMWFGDTALVAIDDEDPTTLRLAYAVPGSVYLFAPTETSVPPPEDVTLTGKLWDDSGPIAGGSVYAHGALATSDADGHFTLHVRTRGALTISPVIGNRHFSQPLPLTGKMTYEQSFGAVNECVENCN